MNQFSDQILKPDGLKFVLPISFLYLAVLFNLGFFQIIGRGWFLLFSLSDHVLLALTALPGIFMILMSVYLFLGYPWLFEKYIIPKIASAGRPDRSKRSRFALRLIFLLVVVGLFVLEVYFIETWMIFTGFILGPLLVSLYFVIRALSRFRFALLVASFVISSLSAFGFGIAYAYVTASSEAYPYFLKERGKDELKGVLLMSGDKGLLFFIKATKATKFYRWDSIESLSRQPK